jgi:hypothetical protein
MTVLNDKPWYDLALPTSNIYSLNGHVPQTIVKDEAADISAIALYCWYEGVMFHDMVIPFSEDNMVLGQDLGPAIDIRPAMARKILKDNGQVVI